MVAKEDKANCILCKIVAGTSPVSLIYQDENIMVFPDLYPINPGHLLIIPKAHVTSMVDLEPEIAADMMKMAIRLDKAIRKSHFQCQGVNIFIADGEAAGQDVFHFHLHVIPRFSGDGFGFKYDKSKHFLKMERATLNDAAKEIKAILEEI
jgi:histidine triad (HIT) family protein